MDIGTQCFGSPPGLEGLGGQLAQTGTGLDQVCADARQEVARLYPSWQGPAADDFRRYITNQLASALRVAGTTRRFSATVYTLVKGLGAAIVQFQQAQMVARANLIYITPDLDTIPFGPDAEAALPEVRAMIETARATANEARIQAETSLDAIETSGDWLGDIAMILLPGAGRPAPRVPPRPPLPRAPLKPAAAAVRTPAADWAALRKQAEQPEAVKKDNGFSTRSARAGTHEVVIVEGRITTAVDPKDSLAGYTQTLPGEHATHGVGMQGGENSPGGIASASAKFNLSEMKRFENATRSTSDIANALGGSVETRSVLQIEHQTVIDGRGAPIDVPVLVGVDRESWLRFPGSDSTFTFARMRATLDPVTREVTIIQNDVLKPVR
jgi:uncharacterized protein YukE